MRRYFDEDEGYDEEPKQVAQRSFLPAEGLTGVDWLLALSLMVVVAAGSTVFAFPGMCPDAWKDAAIAAGLRPPETIFPAFWHVCARLFYQGGISAGNTILVWAGRLLAGVAAGLAFVFLRSLLSLLVRGRLRYAVRRYVVQRGAAFCGALFFACSDPVWRAGQTFVPSGLLMILTLLTLSLWLLFLLNGRLLSALCSAFLVGTLTAETPMGFFLLVFCWVAYSVALRHDALCDRMPLLNPVVGQSTRWHLTFFWAIGFCLGVALNCWSFSHCGGLQAVGKSVGDLPVMYGVQWWSSLINAATGLGWVLGLGVCVLPFMVALVMLPRAMDEEQFLPYHIGAVSFFTGALAFAQLAMLAPLWFWCWTSAAQVLSPYFHASLLLLSAATVSFALTVFGGNVCCRNYERLAMQRFAELHEDDDDDEKPKAPRGGRGLRGGLVIFAIACIVLAAGVLPGRFLGRAREMVAVIEDYVQEVLEEAGSARWIITDGLFDARLELEAARQGRSLTSYSYLPARTLYDRNLLLRNLSDNEDRLSVTEGGAPMLLRSWIRDKPRRLAETAVQIGFPIWKRDGKEIPMCSGVLSRPAGMDEATRLKGVERTTGIGNRILDIYARGGLMKSAGGRIYDLFQMVQGRITFFARHRAERFDHAGQQAQAKLEEQFADKLESTNESLQQLLVLTKQNDEFALRRITPREGLRMALANANFALASRYAGPILDAEPDDPDANFGMGMLYYVQGQWTRAETHLRRCLVKRPKQPATLNNLALVCSHLGRFDEADRFAQQALAIIPNSSEVKDTVKEIAKARQAAAVKAEKEAKEKARAKGDS